MPTPRKVKNIQQISAASAYFSSDDEDPSQAVPFQVVDQMIHDICEKDNEAQNDQISSNKIVEIRVNQRGSTPVPVSASTNPLLPINNDYDNVLPVNENSERLYTINEAKHYLSFQSQRNLKERKSKRKNNSRQLDSGVGGELSSGETDRERPGAVLHFSFEYIRKQFTRTKKKIGLLNPDKMWKINGQILVMFITLLYLAWTICCQSSMISEQSLELQRTKDEVEILREKVKILSKVLDSYDRLVGLELLILNKSNQIIKLEDRVAYLEGNMTEFTSILKPVEQEGEGEGGEDSLWKWNILGGGGGSGGSAIESEKIAESEDLNLKSKLNSQNQNQAVDSFQRSLHQMKHNFPHQTTNTWIQILSQIMPSLENFPNSRPSVLSVLSPPEMPSQFANCFVRKLANAINLAHGEGHDQQNSSPSPKILNGQEYFEEMGEGSVITKCHQDLKEYLDYSNEQWGKAIVVNQISEISKEDYLMVFQAFCDNAAALDFRASFIFLIEIPREFYHPDKWSSHWNGKQILHDFLNDAWKKVLTNDKRASLISRIAPATILLQIGDTCNL